MVVDITRYTRDFPSLRFQAYDQGILELIIANERQRNAATEAMHRDLAMVWRTVDVDDAVRVVVVRGEGNHFSAGGEFSMIDNMINDEATFAADNARILDGHTRLGVAAGDHAVIIWPLLCGLAKARYHLLTNKPLSGAEAERIGLFAMAVPDDAVIDNAFEVARTLAASSATATRWTKHALNNWLRLAGLSFDTSLALEFLGFRLRDAREGMAAMREKRPPSFEDKKVE